MGDIFNLDLWGHYHFGMTLARVCAFLNATPWGGPLVRMDN